MMMILMKSHQTVMMIMKAVMEKMMIMRAVMKKMTKQRRQTLVSEGEREGRGRTAAEAR